jgi:ABC-type transporter MlaC component
MVVEGISLISSKQSEFDSVLRKNGVAVLVELMRQV